MCCKHIFMCFLAFYVKNSLCYTCTLSFAKFEPLGMRPNSITNYNKVGFVPSHLAVIVSLISTMKDEGFDFYPILEKVQAYEKARIESKSK